jgi:hypothetical protein
MTTPWEQAKESRSEIQERRTGEKPGHRPQVNSGRRWYSLRDAMHRSPVGRILIDNKDTESASYTIKLGDFEKLKRDANRTPPGCLPAMQIDIRNLRLMLMEEATYDDIVKYIQILEKRVRESLNDRDSEAPGPVGEMPEVQD